MCGYCTENMAFRLVHSLRTSSSLPAEESSHEFTFILQEFDGVLGNPDFDSWMTAFIACEDNSISHWSAGLLLARCVIDNYNNRRQITPLSAQWISAAEKLMQRRNSYQPDSSPHAVAEKIATLWEYVNLCVVSASLSIKPFELEEQPVPNFDIYEKLPDLVHAILLLGKGAGTAEDKNLLNTIAAGYPRASPPYFDGIELWLERLALCALWHLHGMDAILILIQQHIRPELLLYLRDKVELSDAEQLQLATVLQTTDHYSSSSSEYQYVLDELLTLGES